MANVIEVLLRLKDQTAPALSNFKKNIDGVRTSVSGLTGIIAAVGSGVALGALIRNINEAEEATSKLDAAFKQTGQGLGLTRQQLDELATSIQSTTVFGDDLVKTAESVLLSFDRVRGQAFERTIKVAADLSTRLGGDLVDAVRSVGFALQSPEEGLSRLRRAGIQFDDSQKQLIKTLVETGQVGQAQSVILTELERKFGGAAAAARNTLGGALAGLKNAFGDLFEGTAEGTSEAAASINELTKTLSDPSVKEGFDTIVAALGEIVSVGAKAFAVIINGVKSAAEAVAKAVGGVDVFQEAEKGVEALTGQLDELQLQLSELPSVGFAGLREILIRDIEQTGQAIAIAIDLEKSKLLAKGGGGGGLVEDGGITINSTPLIDTFDLMTKATADFAEQLQKDRVVLDELTLALESASFTQWQKDIADAEAQLAPFLDEAAAEVKRSSDEIGLVLGDNLEKAAKDTEAQTAIMRGAFEDLGRTIKDTFSDMFYDFEFSGDRLLDSVRRIFADIAATILTSGISDALSSAFSSSGGGSFLSSLFAGFGASASGGREKGWTWVGEEGPELVNMGAGSNVYNARQLAFAGGGGGGGAVTYAPQTNITVQGNMDREAEARLLQTIEYRNQRQREELERTLARNGIELRQ